MKSRREIVHVILCLHLYDFYLRFHGFIQMNGKKCVTKQANIHTPLESTQRNSHKYGKYKRN